MMRDVAAMHLRLRIERMGVMRAAAMAETTSHGWCGQNGYGDQRGGNGFQHGRLLSISIKKVTGRDGRACRSCRKI
jgi:hypothetical protein